MASPLPPATLLPIDAALIERIRNRIVSTCQLRALYLFGSAARGEAVPGSDVDLLVVMELPEGVTAPEQAGRLRRLFDGWLVPFDILVQTPEDFTRTQRLPGHIAYTATQKGQLLFEGEEDA